MTVRFPCVFGELCSLTDNRGCLHSNKLNHWSPVSVLAYSVQSLTRMDVFQKLVEMSWTWDVTGYFPEPWPHLKVTTCVWWLPPLMEGNQSTWKSMRGVAASLNLKDTKLDLWGRHTESLVNFKDVRHNHVPCSAWVERELALFTQPRLRQSHVKSTRVSTKIWPTM